MPDRVLVATLPRWLAMSSGLVAATFALHEGLAHVSHAGRSASAGAWWLGPLAVLETLLVFAILRAEDARLSRELRIARTGTPLLRTFAARPRSELPLLGRLFATRLGTAAICLADGDRMAALGALASASPLMHAGRLADLRRIVDADIDRAAGAPASLSRCIAALSETPPLAHREAELYRIHVLVKAVLERGDAEVGAALAERLSLAKSEDERMYAAWLRVWFDLEGRGASIFEWAPLSEGELRLAALTARAQGAPELVALLEERLLPIAKAAPRE